MDGKLIQQIIETVNFAAIKHRNQRRKDLAETPYINHPVGVANILCYEGGVTDPVVIQAALLHDTVEDTDTTFEEIRSIFGEKIAGVVAEVTDDKALAKEERKRLQIVNASHKSHEAKLVKLADKLYNLRDLKASTPVGWSEQRVQEYFEWAAQVIRGVRGTNKALEDKLDELFKERNISI